MKDNQIINSFEEQGYIIIKQVLSSGEVKELRSFILDKIQRFGNKRFLFSNEMLNYSEFFQLYFKGRIVETLKKVLGNELCYYNDFSVQHNVFGGWHRDCDGEVPAKYLLAPDYKFAKCGIFLQDNSAKWGGGIDILPGGHKFPVNSGFCVFDHYMKKIFNRLMIKIKSMRVNIQAGDMVVFDSRLPHASTFPGDMTGLTKGHMDKVHGIPEEHAKFVVYWNAANIKMENFFLLHRETFQVMNSDGEELITTRILSSFFPDDFPDEFVKLSRENAVKISTLSKEKCLKFKRRLEQAFPNNSNH